MSSIKLDWAGAEVRDATLTVALEGELPKDWKRSFERTVALLGDGDWGEIRLKKGAVRVRDVAPGTEEKLRHHLEAIVTQANAAHERQEAEAHAEDRDGEDEEGNDGSDDERQGPDAEMTAQFRAFADPPEPGA
jgi:hypothetical protein